MNTCKHCKHWGRWLKGVCDIADGEPNESDPKSFGIIASAADDTDLQAVLKTGPDFGCVLFTPKDSPKQP